MVNLLYGYHYNIYPIYVSTDDVGHSGCSRNRVYVILAHKTRSRMLFNPYKMYKKVRKTIRKHVSTRPSDYLIAPKHEILLDAAEIARIRKLKLETWLKFMDSILFVIGYYYQ